jgi:hypothetical protein
MEKNAILTVNLENLDMETGARVAQEAILQEIYLVDAKISRKPLINCPEVLTLEHHCSTERLSRDDDDSFVLESVLCNFRVAAFSEKSPKKLIMKIEATFCTSFDLNLDLVPDLDHDDEDKDYWETFRVLWVYFNQINPITTAWPYWREFVQSMSTRMGFPALTVPLLEIVPKKAATKKAKSQPVKKQATRRKKVNA